MECLETRVGAWKKMRYVTTRSCQVSRCSSLHPSTAAPQVTVRRVTGSRAGLSLERNLYGRTTNGQPPAVPTSAVHHHSWELPALSAHPRLPAQLQTHGRSSYELTTDWSRREPYPRGTRGDGGRREVLVAASRPIAHQQGKTTQIRTVALTNSIEPRTWRRRLISHRQQSYVVIETGR